MKRKHIMRTVKNIDLLTACFSLKWPECARPSKMSQSLVCCKAPGEGVIIGYHQKCCVGGEGGGGLGASKCAEFEIKYVSDGKTRSNCLTCCSDMLLHV